jgi:hypothetical protein
LYTSNFLTQSSPRAAFGNPHPEYPHVPFFNLSRVLTPSCLSSVHYPILPIFLSTVPTHPISYASTSQNQNSNKNTKHHAECTHPSQPISPNWQYIRLNILISSPSSSSPALHSHSSPSHPELASQTPPALVPAASPRYADSACSRTTARAGARRQASRNKLRATRRCRGSFWC